MIFYSDRLKIVEKYREWLIENPIVKDCYESLVGFMIVEGLLKDRTECNFYDEKIIKPIDWSD